MPSLPLTPLERNRTQGSRSQAEVKSQQSQQSQQSQESSKSTKKSKKSTENWTQTPKKTNDISTAAVTATNKATQLIAKMKEQREQERFEKQQLGESMLSSLASSQPQLRKSNKNKVKQPKGKEGMIPWLDSQTLAASINLTEPQKQQEEKESNFEANGIQYHLVQVHPFQTWAGRTKSC